MTPPNTGSQGTAADEGLRVRIALANIRVPRHLTSHGTKVRELTLRRAVRCSTIREDYRATNSSSLVIASRTSAISER
jgi:hypothetical protein